jgi:hypothetical protein
MSSIYFDRESLSFVGLTPDVRKQLKQMHPDVDLDRELLRMSFWLQSPKGKQRKGLLSFIVSWLGRAASRLNAPQENHSNYRQQKQVLEPIEEDFLQDLWKKSKLLLQLNSTTRP